MKITNGRLMPESSDFGPFGTQAGLVALLDRVEEAVGLFSSTEDSDDIACDDIAASGTVTITEANANALTVGRQGATDPVLKVNSATASQATGISITGAAAAGGVAVAAISSGTDESMTINAKGSGTVTIGGTSTGNVVVGTALAFGTDASAAKTIVAGTTNGLKIGTAVGQKIGLWNVTPVIQPASANQAAVTTSVTTTATTTNLKTTVAAIIVLLNQIRSDLVAFGGIKGSA